MHFLSDQTTSKGVEKLQVESSIAKTSRLLSTYSVRGRGMGSLGSWNLNLNEGTKPHPCRPPGAVGREDGVGEGAANGHGASFWPDDSLVGLDHGDSRLCPVKMCISKSR